MSEIFIIKNTGKGVINSLAPENVVPIKSAGSSDGGVITEDSDTVAFTGNGTSLNPLVATSVLTLEQARLNGNILEGDVQFYMSGDYNISKNTNPDDGESKTASLSYGDVGNVALSVTNHATNKNGFLSLDESSLQLSIDTETSKGFTAITVFNKQGDRKAFAQLSDVYDANSYSTTETLTGGTWIDGKPIYRKVLPYTFDSDGIGYLNFSDLNTNTIIHCNALYRSLDGNMCKEYNTFALNSIEYFYSKLSSELPEVTIYLQNIDLTTGFTVPIEPDNSNGFLILEYTKTTSE